MSFPRYPEYRDSGVEVPGQVPSHWEVLPLKYLSSLKGRLGWQGLKADEYTAQGPFLVTSEHFENDKVAWERCYHVSDERFAVAPEIQLGSHDLLMMKDGAAMGKLAYIDALPGPACLNSHLLLFRPIHGRHTNRFLYYLLSGPAFETYMLRERRGSTFFGISQESIGNFPFAVPPLSEQFTITGFLDRETGKIDALMGEQKRLIELLKEKRQAVISHAVTKGLNPDVQMKDSGVDWLGSVPAHWRLMQIKHLTLSIGQGWSPQCEGYPADFDTEWGVLKVGCVNGGDFDPSENKLLPSELQPMPALTIRRDDVMISRANTRSLVGSAAVARRDYPTLMLCDKLYRVRLLPDACVPDFLCRYLASGAARGQLELEATGASSSMVNIGQGAITDLLIPVPSIGEQRDIVAHIDRALARIDSLMADAQRAIDLLQERRTALISAAVTGQIDVRSTTPSTPVLDPKKPSRSERKRITAEKST